MMPRWIASCDGSWSPKSKEGGWAYVLLSPEGTVKEEYGCSLKPTTINRMEFCAILKALKSIPDNRSVTVYSDSKYCVQSLGVWLHRWVRNNFVKLDGTKVENRGLMMWIRAEINRLGNVEFVHKPRNSTPDLERADFLAKLGRKQYAGPKLCEP
jgi:ribonuclease HI